VAGPELAVVDASVAAKWFLTEPESGPALGLRQAHVEGRVALHAPVFLPFEVANALRFHPGLGAEPVASAVAQLFGVQIRLEPPGPESVSRAVEVAYRTGLTVYDASYLALAERLDCTLYSADERQCAAAPSRAVHIRDFPGG
jgi:predicted nucleic acid-binding protein